MKPLFRRMHRGFTLIELSLAIMLGMATGAMVLALFNNQMAFLKIYSAQNFLTEEAPIISMYVGKLVGKADRFRLHNTVEDAAAGLRVVDTPDTPSSVVVLNYRQPDGTVRASILAFDKESHALYYYVVPVNGVLGAPQWAVTKKATDVTFSMEKGILRMELRGPSHEKITYSGAMQ
ncbi:MAG: prepilin-type N-terminal cleavage/methylation domain-containing protein [Luteolibacter sp.]